MSDDLGVIRFWSSWSYMMNIYGGAFRLDLYLNTHILHFIFYTWLLCSMLLIWFLLRPLNMVE